jgi:hypothetical protein
VATSEIEELTENGGQKKKTKILCFDFQSYFSVPHFSVSSGGEKSSPERTCPAGQVFQKMIELRQFARKTERSCDEQREEGGRTGAE